MYVRKSVCLFALLSALLLGSCAGVAKDQPAGVSANQSFGASVAGFPLTIDNCGHQLTFRKTPARTVSLNQSSIEIQFSLGIVDKMVGIAIWTDPVLSSLESENAKVERISDGGSTSETVIAKEPDFITASFPSTLIDKVVGSYEKYESLGVSAYLVPSQCGKKSGDDAPAENFIIERVYQEVDELSRIHGVPEEGGELTAQLRQRLEKAVAQKPGKPVKVMFWLANSEAPYLAGGPGASQSVNDQLGITNIYFDQHNEWPQVSWEDVAAKNLDVIVMSDFVRKSQTAETADAKVEYLRSNPVTSQMDTVKNERFTKVAGGDMNPSIRTVGLAEKLVAGIEQFGLKWGYPRRPGVGAGGFR